MSALEMIGALALVGLAVVVAIAKAFAVDEARGYLQSRVRADVEATIASLPPELQEQWGEEWRAELAAVISMPLTAIRLARGLRQAAGGLVGEVGAAPAVTVGKGGPIPSQRSLRVGQLRTPPWARVGQRVDEIWRSISPQSRGLILITITLIGPISIAASNFVSTQLAQSALLVASVPFVTATWIIIAIQRKRK